MNRLIPIEKHEDILPEYQDTPIGSLLKYHNLNHPQEPYSKAELLVGMCMDSRKNLNLPENFAFVLRAGGANLKYSEFKVSYAIGIGGIKHIAVIGHNNCGMVNLNARKEEFIKGLTENAGWKEGAAEEHFSNFSPKFEIGNEIEFVVKETIRLRKRYPKVKIAPLFYNVDDNRLYLIEE